MARMITEAGVSTETAVGVYVVHIIHAYPLAPSEEPRAKWLSILMVLVEYDLFERNECLEVPEESC